MKRAIASFAFVLLTTAAFPAAAQEPAEAEKLQKQVDQLQKTVEELQRRLAALEGSKAPQTPAQTPAPVLPPVPDYNALGDQQQAAPRTDNIPLDPQLKGFIAIPGTASMFKLGGSARVDLIYDSDDNGNPNWFNPSSMPVEGESGYISGARSALHGKGTRFNIDFRRPVREHDQLRIFYENDFFGDSASPTMTYRVRHFYGQASNLLLGQTYSGFEDVDAWPDVVDYLGPNAVVNRRQAQIRYTRPLSRADGNRRSIYFSAELPSAEVDVKSAPFPDGTRAVNRLPDFVLGYRVERKAGHLQIAALVRRLTVETPEGRSAATTGWGLNISGARAIGSGDKISYQLVYGEGVERYLNDTNGQNLDAAAASGGQLDAVPVFAPVVGYGHQWNDRWRSTVSYSLVRIDAPPSLDTSALENSNHFSVNLVYQPMKEFRVGLEYLHGNKQIVSGARGDANRLNLVVKYDLVK